MPTASTLLTSPVCCKSTPSRMPSGLAVMKLPLATLMSDPAIGELTKPMENKASISTRMAPLASLTASIAWSSVTRRPLTNLGVILSRFKRRSICGRAPCTSTSLTSKLASKLRSWDNATNCFSSTTSPPNAMTKVRPPKAWI